MIRLQKYLAQCGVASRRAAERMIAQGRVSIDDAPATLGRQIDPDQHEVKVDGALVALQTKKVYVVLNKPENVVTTAADTHGRKTVIDCLEGVQERVFPVGRLDMDVRGVLLLTNDGEMAHHLMHPSFEVQKTYIAWVEGKVLPEEIQHLEEGVLLDDGMTSPAKARILTRHGQSTKLRLTIHEGRKREVKRMCAAIGHPVERLQRVAFGAIRATGLREGEWRYLSEMEVQELRQKAGL